MDTARDTKVLNSLIETTLDSVKGYADASEHDGRHRALFDEMARERSQVASRLQAQVSALGGDPQERGSLGGAAHRGFMNLKDAVVGRDEKSIVEEVERGEDYLKEKYETALGDAELSPSVRESIEQAYQSVRKGHDRVSAIKHQMAG